MKGLQMKRQPTPMTPPQERDYWQQRCYQLTGYPIYCEGCGGDRHECQCSQPLEVTPEDVDYLAAVYSSPY